MGYAGCGRPRRITQNAIMMIPATSETLAAPPIPCFSTAWARKGTMAFAVPPIRTGLRPGSAVIGAIKMEVKTPGTGGRLMSEAIASPYGSAIDAAIAPPQQSPLNCGHP